MAPLRDLAALLHVGSCLPVNFNLVMFHHLDKLITLTLIFAKPCIKIPIQSFAPPALCPSFNTANMTESTITESSIKAALVDRLKATHVEVQDMSGKLPILAFQSFRFFALQR